MPAIGHPPAAALAGLALVLLASSCGTRCPFPETILFTEGVSGTVDLACPDGSDVRALLSPTKSLSFPQTAGISLLSPIVLTSLDETATEPASAARLTLYNPATGRLSFLTQLTGQFGWYAMAPDGRHVAFEYFPQPNPTAELRIANLSTQQAAALLTFPATVQFNAPAWRPDGREILFIQLDLSSYPEIIPSLEAVSYPGGQTRNVFGPDVGASGVAFAPDGDRFAMWSNRGLEIVKEDTLQREVVLPLSRLGGRRLGTAGLLWGVRDNLIAFVLYDPSLGESELWDVRPDGSVLQLVYSVPPGFKLFLGSFVIGPWYLAHPYPPQ